MDIEMERMMGCKIPAFGLWNYCSDHLPTTHYLDLAMQARLLNRRQLEQARLPPGSFNSTSSQSPRKPAQIKVIRTQVDQKQSNAGGLLQEDIRLSDSATRRHRAAVDEDLYKVPPPLIYHKPRRKMRNVVWSLWIGCLGLDCIA
ncbi:uncharacterized protein LOC100822519 [Brachypodium distachyon]|uniref:Uncharacterized protein n=1 Tax=Brachypodium distachyon TaxID=15368 RepID=I1GYH2_BRADI|nr:uncharacterized protein LOC100822519 [Brachypodium distachyon]KQK18329.1 hypothetical protein BRADI_1g41750v3 [Brachypodium distachyon]|eukprot:XP_003563848.2 uncharacterized protein LOC100822519 [Brachypodium distachyon]